MAEENAPSSSGSWWGSWIDSAKSKSASVLEAVKKDLDELSTAVKTEASNAGAALAGSLKFDEPDSTVSTVKKSLSTFFGQVTEVLNPSVDDDDTETILITNNGTITLTGFQKHLAELQMNEETYLMEPGDELIEKYKRWMEVVEQDQFTENRLTKHLTNSQILNEKYLTLVPDKLPHMEFWKRYLFKRALLEDALANAELAERRAKQEINSTKPSSPRKSIIQTTQPKKVDDGAEEIGEDVAKNIVKDDLKWDTEDFACNMELSEEEQARLLAEYELEIQEREKRKSEPLIESIGQEMENAEKKTSTTTAQKTSNQNVNNKQKSTKLNENNKMGKNVKATTTATTEGKKGNQNLKTNNSKVAQPQPQQQQQQQTTNKNNKKTTNTDNNKKTEQLTIEKNHFPKEDAASSNSDESWEKEFDLEE